MPTGCSPARFEFVRIENRAVVAGFDAGAITSDADALLLGATDRAIGLVRRFAACFRDARAPERVDHAMATLVGHSDTVLYGYTSTGRYRERGATPAW
jgi:hypothetical protein